MTKKPKAKRARKVRQPMREWWVCVFRNGYPPCLHAHEKNARECAGPDNEVIHVREVRP